MSQKAGFDVPDWFTPVEAEYLTGASSNPRVVGNATLKGFESHAFQEALEDEIENNVPLKGGAMLGNAGFQRCAIAASNTLFGWTCYPTFFGSTYVFSPDDESISEMPKKKSSGWDASLADFVDSAKRWSADHPDIEVVVAMLGSGSYSARNAAYEYVSDAQTYDEIADMLDRESTDNLTFITARYDDDAAYYRDYFRADHHWNMRGAYRSYQEIASALDLPVFGDESDFETEENVFVGSHSRFGLMRISEDVPLLDDDYTMLRIVGNDGDAGRIGYGSVSPSEPGAIYDYEKRRYGGLSHDAITGGYGDKNVMLVADSFERSIHRMLAKSSKTLYSTNSLYFDEEDKRSLAEHLADRPSDAVVYIGRLQDYISFDSRHPNWFL